jgi:pimeloyl-ACP methyl ester carboxylesterase
MSTQASTQVASTSPTSLPPLLAFDLARDAVEYWIDAWQRSVLTLNVMRQRTARYEEHAAKLAPHVLKFDCELLIDGRKLSRPVNYMLVRIKPPKGVKIDEKKRPFVVVDPRAGHGPGIGGFKPESEIGVAFKAGHPCYFIGFLPEPVAGQTIEDIATAEATFLERIIALHPASEGKPAVIGNCQAGWAVMLLAALRPELFGPIIIAGSPLSYWAGVRGDNPLRYTGGLLGGSWLTALTGDMGSGKFDGAWLVSNFENLNPSNTLWSKPYNLYANVDKEAPRYLEFEQWWGAHVLLNADEMQFIADELFIGNKLSHGRLTTNDGTQIDLRNISSPILAFCSKADNITPPQQALGWILDLYGSVNDIRAHGQTIVYAIHETIGHLGIFVSGSVARKEHEEFASNIDLIDVLPPGLYEAVITPRAAHEASDDLIGGNYVVRFEARTLDDIRALGGNDDADDLEFAAAARLSETNLGLYRTFVQPWLRQFANDGLADAMRQFHPLRLQYTTYSAANPFMWTLDWIANTVDENRRPVSESNIFWKAQKSFSDYVETSLDSYRDARDKALESTFHAIYGSPLLQALMGLKAGSDDGRRPLAMTASHAALVRQRIVELKRGVADGGPREAALRCLIYVRMPDGVIDERGFNFLRAMRREAGKGYSLEEFKRVFRDQFLMLLLDERRALAAIPSMFAQDADLAHRMEDALRRMIDAVGLRSDEAKSRMAEIEHLIEEAEEQIEVRGDNGHKRQPAHQLRRIRVHSARGGKHP